MLKLRTAKNTEIPITWIGISDFDGSLRFETSETNLAELFMIFNDPEHTICLTRVFDEADSKVSPSSRELREWETAAPLCV